MKSPASARSCPHSARSWKPKVGHLRDQGQLTQRGPGSANELSSLSSGNTNSMGGLCSHDLRASQSYLLMLSPGRQRQEDCEYKLGLNIT